MPVDADALLVTAGNSQAISHTAALFSRRNKRVFVEAPTYFLAFDLFRELGLDVAAVPVDGNGLDVRAVAVVRVYMRATVWPDTLTGMPVSAKVDALEKRLTDGDVPAFLYTIPTFHNPTGTVLSAERRTRLLALAETFAFRIISDEPYNLLSLDTAPHAPLASYDASGLVVSLGSFSKILAPGLRLGAFLRRPAALELWHLLTSPHMIASLRCRLGAEQSRHDPRARGVRRDPQRRRSEPRHRRDRPQW